MNTYESRETLATLYAKAEQCTSRKEAKKLLNAATDLQIKLHKDDRQTLDASQH